MSTHRNNRLEPAFWIGSDATLAKGEKALCNALKALSKPVYLVGNKTDFSVAQTGSITIGNALEIPEGALPLAAHSPPLMPEDLGDPGFKASHQIRYAYICGAMANGITSVEMVKSAGRAGMLGFFGSGGLTLGEVEKAVDILKNKEGSYPFGFNLIHSPNDMALEQKIVDLYLEKEIRLISASAYLRLTLPLVYYRVKGIHKALDGRIISPNKVIAKISRVEIAKGFFSPPPQKLVQQLLSTGLISEQEARLSQFIPMAEDVTAEADSGGHTDNRPALSLLPTIMSLRDDMAKQFDYQCPLRVGLGGGIATPESAAAAFAMGAAFILTGSVNQSCVEAGTSETVKKMLCEAKQADVIMAPAADMFEMGVKVQVLKRGTMFSMRASKLYDLYCAYDRYEDIPLDQRLLIEKTVFKEGFDKVWENTRTFFLSRDPEQVAKADKNPKHKMALVFRSYLGRASVWAKTGDPERIIDYQIWCGPAMGAFNAWVNGTFLEKPENRKTGIVARNLLYGACVTTRAFWLRNQGATIPTGAGRVSPLTMENIEQMLKV